MKTALETLNLEMGDFKLRRTDSRRYPGATFTWYAVDFDGESYDAGDPNQGRMTTAAKHSFILGAIYAACPAIPDYIAALGEDFTTWHEHGGELRYMWDTRNKPKNPQDLRDMMFSRGLPFYPDDCYKGQAHCLAKAGAPTFIIATLLSAHHNKPAKEQAL